MKCVQLSLKRGSSESVETISADFEDAELALLRSYVEHVGRVRLTALLVRGMPAISNLKWEPGAGIVFTCAPYADSELHELLHVLRPVILQREPASFQNISGLLGRRFQSRNFSDHLKVLRRVFDHGELNLYMQVSIDDQPLFHDSLLDTWLNGAQYHTDAEKAAAWRELENTLRSENARALVMSQLQGRVKALFNLDYVCSLVLKKCDDA